MNKRRLKRIAEIEHVLNALQETLEQIASEEQEAFDSLPESIQESEKGIEILENAETLQELSDALSEVCTGLGYFHKETKP